MLLRGPGWQGYWRNSKFLLYPLQIVEDRSQVMAELRGMSFAFLVNFLDDRVSPHFRLPTTLPAYR
jgi:hypothetical protein